MIKIDNINVYGWEPAIRGMRNPMNSWEKSDSCECSIEEMEYSKCLTSCTESEIPEKCINCKGVYLGENDLKLMQSLSKAGTDHSKFLRMIVVTMDITAPLYWWKEFDTYKVGTATNSCSTMHKIHEKRFEREDFSIEHIENCAYPKCELNPDGETHWMVCMDNVIASLNVARELFLQTGDKKYWWQMIQLLPSSYNQKRTVLLNYQVLKNMYFARRNHKLDEWHTFCEEIEKLPYFKEICIEPME
jgi:hypothetical protein